MREATLACTGDDHFGAGTLLSVLAYKLDRLLRHILIRAMAQDRLCATVSRRDQTDTVLWVSSTGVEPQAFSAQSKHAPLRVLPQRFLIIRRLSDRLS